MHFSKSFLAAALVAIVAADFQVYYVGENQADPNPDNGAGQITSFSIMVFDGEPSCDDAANGYASLPVVGDASSSGYARCEGCGANSAVTQLEINEGGDWGHYTLYDPTFELTPADGGPLRGSCVVDTADTFDCGLPFGQLHGDRLFICTSDLVGIHAK